MRWFVRMLLAAAMLLSGIPAAASATIEADVRRILANSEIVGAAVILVEGNAPPTIITYGIADRDAGRPVDESTLFRIGSISKNLTSLLAVRLAASGQLDLNSPVPPDFGIANRWADQPIRLVHLLEHTAGIEGSSFAEYGTNRPDAAIKDYVAMQRGRLSARWPPGLFFSYANAGHTLAAAMMERATGTDFDRLMADQVFAPIGMASATFRHKDVLQGQLSKSYAGGREVEFWALPNRPSGAAIASPTDMAALVRFYASDGLGPDSAPLVSPDWIARMRAPATTLAARQAPIAGAYGLGTFGFAVEGRLFYGHWGKIDGFVANMGILPGTGRGFAILSNTNDGAATAQLRSAIARYLMRDLPAPRLPEPARFPLDAYAGIYQPFTHDMPLRSWIWETLGLTLVTPAPDGRTLLLKPLLPTPLGGEQKLIPVDYSRLRVSTLAEPTVAFLSNADARYIVGASEEALRRIPTWMGWLHAAVAASTVIFLIVAPLVALVSVGRRLAGQRTPAFVPVAFSGLTAFALILLLAGFAAFGLFGVLDVAGSLGRVSVASLSLAVASISFVLLLGVAIATTWLRRRAMAPTIRIYLLLCCATLVAAAIYLARNGWIPLLTWR